MFSSNNSKIGILLAIAFAIFIIVDTQQDFDATGRKHLIYTLLLLGVFIISAGYWISGYVRAIKNRHKSPMDWYRHLFYLLRLVVLVFTAWLLWFSITTLFS